MNSYHLQILGRNIRVDAMSEIVDYLKSQKEELRASFPGYGSAEGEEEFVINFIPSPGGDLKIVVSEREAVVSLPEISDTEEFECDIRRIITSVIACFLQREQIFLVHASAVEYAGRGILLLGGSGSGKTSVAVRMHLDHKAKILGDETVALALKEGNISILGGGSSPELRENTIRANFPELVRTYQEEKRYEGVLFLPDIVERGSFPLRVDMICLVRADYGKTGVAGVVNVSAGIASKHLFEALSEAIQGGEYAPSVKWAIPSLDTPEFVSERLHAIRECGLGLRMTMARGDINEIVNILKERA